MMSQRYHNDVTLMDRRTQPAKGASAHLKRKQKKGKEAKSLEKCLRTKLGVSDWEKEKKKGSGYCALYKKRDHRRRNEKSEKRRKGMLRILSWETEESLGQRLLRTLQVTRSAISSSSSR